MITIDNYFNKTAAINFSSYPEALRKGHELVLKATNNGSSWTAYHSSDTIKKTIDLYLSKLSEFLRENNKAGDKQSKSGKQQSHHEAGVKAPVKKQDLINLHSSGNAKKEKPAKPVKQTASYLMVERIPEELRFIKRFINLHGKTKTKDEVLRFINSLQKAILEKRIRKTSPYAEQVKMIQDKLIGLYNGMKTKVSIELKPGTYDKLKELTGEEKVMPSVNFIKRYISLNGKTGMKKKAADLLKQLIRSLSAKKILSSDPYRNEIVQITDNLKNFLDDPAMKTLSIEKNELNGLEGTLGCACQPLSGVDETPAVMNSMDFANMRFQTIGLKGKWFDFIGDPSSNFTAMVFGKPKLGKSTLCIEFAAYLARNHGSVLYVAREEGLDYTLQQKMEAADIKHPNLYVASAIPENLEPYDFIFLDSVNKLNLKPDDLSRLKAMNPDKSFVFVFQTTKAGAFRGANTFQHDVDIVIEVPEWGKAVQMGRFNQGGEMRIF